MKSEEAIIKAHDLLDQYVRDPELDDLDLMAAAQDALCWVLNHSNNPSFGHNLNALDGLVRDAERVEIDGSEPVPEADDKP